MRRPIFRLVVLGLAAASCQGCMAAVGAGAGAAAAAATPTAVSLFTPTVLSDVAKLACDMQGYANAKGDTALSVIAGLSCLW